MNIELYEGQVATVYITLEGDADVYEVYGGTSKGQFHTEVGDDDMHWMMDVPAESTAGCSVPRYDIFAKRVSTGQEWRILSGKIATKKRQSQVEGECVSPVEYHVTIPLVEDMVIVDGGQVLIGIKGDKGERGVSAYELAVQNGFEGDEREFTNMMVCVQTYAEQAEKSADESYDAQIKSEVAAVNALASEQGAADAASTVVAEHAQDSSLHVSASSIQQVAPIAWGKWNATPTATSYLSLAVGSEANAADYSTALGSNAAATSRSLAVGYKTKATGRFATAMGNTSEATSSVSITIGSAFEDTSGKYECKTQGTGSITIGAGANTLNNGDVESSNSVTIGCKAENKGADSVVIGAQAKTTAGGTIAIGAGAEVADAGAVVFASHSSDRTMRTQLYFCGAGTPLAVEYYNGEAFMGYTVVDKATGQIAACGTRRLSELFPDNSLTQPASLDENGEWVMPKVFHPSDLDLPVEEPTEDVEINIPEPEVEEYTPLPVYPIVEPEIEEETL